MSCTLPDPTALRGNCLWTTNDHYDYDDLDVERSTMDADTWTVDAVVDRFDPVLREHREAVGYAIKRS